MDRKLEATLNQAKAAINLMVKDPAERRALYGHAVAFVTAETNAGQERWLRRPGSQFIGPFQISASHAEAARNQPEAVRLRMLLQEQERLPPAQRSRDAQLLLNAGATGAPWTVSGSDMHKNQGVLGAVSVVIAARQSSKATGRDVEDLSAAEVWLSHKLGWYGGAGIVKAAAENPRQPVSNVSLFEVSGKTINMGHIRSNFSGSASDMTAGDVVRRTARKFDSKVLGEVMERLSPENRKLYAEATGISMARIERVTGTAVAANDAADMPTPLPKARPDVASVNVAEEATPAATTVAGAIEVKPADIDRRNSLQQASREDVRLVQSELKKAGFRLGRIDGIAGERTERALDAYREKFGRDPEALTTLVARRQPQEVDQVVAAVASAPVAASVAEATSATVPAATATTARMDVAALDDAGSGLRPRSDRKYLDNALRHMGVDKTINADILRHSEGLKSDAGDRAFQQALRDDVRGIQRELRQAGIRVGKIDGLLGDRTERALESYRQKFGRDPEALQALAARSRPDEQIVTAEINRQVAEGGVPATAVELAATPPVIPAPAAQAANTEPSGKQKDDMAALVGELPVKKMEVAEADRAEDKKAADTPRIPKRDDLAKEGRGFV